MKKFIPLFLILITAILVSCATSTPQKVPPQYSSGFLKDYAPLTLLKESDGIQVYRYINPKISRKDYDKVILDPVVIYQHANKNNISNEAIYKTKVTLDDNLKKAVAKRATIVNQSGSGVARVSVAITGAIIEKDGFKPRNLIPVSAIIFLATKATGTDNKKPVLIIEAKVVDSLSGNILGETLYVISGDKFRQDVQTVEQFQTLAVAWVNAAVKTAAGG